VLSLCCKYIGDAVDRRRDVPFATTRLLHALSSRAETNRPWSVALCIQPESFCSINATCTRLYRRISRVSAFAAVTMRASRIAGHPSTRAHTRLHTCRPSADSLIVKPCDTINTPAKAQRMPLVSGGNDAQVAHLLPRTTTTTMDTHYKPERDAKAADWRTRDASDLAPLARVLDATTEPPGRGQQAQASERRALRPCLCPPSEPITRYARSPHVYRIHCRPAPPQASNFN